MDLKLKNGIIIVLVHWGFVCGDLVCVEWLVYAISNLGP